MTDKTGSDDDRGGLGMLLGIGAALVLAAGYAGYKLGDARAASGFGGRPCAGCAEKAERARQAEAAEAEAYADLADAEASATAAANGAVPAGSEAGAPHASVG